MEVTEQNTPRNDTKNVSRSSTFECEASTIDSILGRCVLGDRNLRIDAGGSEIPCAEQPLCSNFPKVEIRYATSGLQEPRTQIVRKKPPVFEITKGLQQERLRRLLDQQQAWYDAAQKAALAADQLLQLCEHHQQPWLHNPIRA